MLVLVSGLQGVSRQLKGSKFSVITDSQVVNHFFSKQNRSRRKARWLEVLADFKLTSLQLRPGRINELEDALSRIRNDARLVEHGYIDTSKADMDDLAREKMEGYVEDRAFSNIFRSFADEWPENTKERLRVELLKTHITREGAQLF